MFQKVFQGESAFVNWLIVSSADPTKVAATVKGLTGTVIGILALVIHGPDFSNLPDDVYTVIVDAFTVVTQTNIRRNDPTLRFYRTSERTRQTSQTREAGEVARQEPGVCERKQAAVAGEACRKIALCYSSTIRNRRSWTWTRRQPSLFRNR
jgi:hypothetical protein